MDALLIAVAFFFGLLAKQFGLPPLVGFLISGFVLHALGQHGGETLDTISNLGITLMLFTIGLKLRLRGLLRPEIWAGTSMHIAGTVVTFGLIFLSLSALDVSLFGSLTMWTSLLLALALSFSSTVFAVKALEESGEMGALHGRVAVGILIMQDLIAVMFLTASTGKVPSWISLGLLVGLLVLRPMMGWLMERSGHGELITLCGLFLAVVLGWKGFESVGLKGDLGALFIGVLVGQHSKSKELAKSLIGLTDLLLVGFFLSIGLKGLPDLQEMSVGCLLVLLLPLKVALFFAILTRFHLRARTAWIAGLSLGSYSEFGLIIIALSVTAGWMPEDWLVIEAIALALSFLVAAPLNRKAELLYDKLSSRLYRFETPGIIPMTCRCISRANALPSLEWAGSVSPHTTFLKNDSRDALSASIVMPRRLNCIEEPTATSCWQTRRILISGNACNSRRESIWSFSPCPSTARICTPLRHSSATASKASLPPSPSLMTK
jgi:glutathione-regulated potassium-efflux system ancillary protein KefC